MTKRTSQSTNASRRASYTLGRTIRALRKMRGMKQGELAVRVGMPPQYVSKIETSQSTNPTIGLLSEIAAALGVTTVQLLIVDDLASSPSTPIELEEIHRLISAYGALPHEAREYLLKFVENTSRLSRNAISARQS